MNEPRNEWNRPPLLVERPLDLEEVSWVPNILPTPILGVPIGIQNLLFFDPDFRSSFLGPKRIPRGWPTRSRAHHSTIMKWGTTHRIEPCISSCLSVTSATPTTFSNDSSQSFELFFSNKHWVCDSISLRSLTWQSALLIWVSWFIYQDLGESFCYPGNHHEQIILALILLK